jgi:hypothetical protein
MAATAKVSVALGREELVWARARARRLGKSLSAVLTDTIAAQKRLEALGEVVAWMAEGQPPLTRVELTVASRTLRSRRK